MDLRASIVRFWEEWQLPSSGSWSKQRCTKRVRTWSCPVDPIRCKWPKLLKYLQQQQCPAKYEALVAHTLVPTWGKLSQSPLTHIPLDCVDLMAFNMQRAEVIILIMIDREFSLYGESRTIPPRIAFFWACFVYISWLRRGTFKNDIYHYLHTTDIYLECCFPWPQLIRL